VVIEQRAVPRTHPGGGIPLGRDIGRDGARGRLPPHK